MLTGCKVSPLQACTGPRELGKRDCRSSPSRSSSTEERWLASLDPFLMDLERSRECFQKICHEPKIECMLQTRSASLAGTILRHAFNSMEKLFAQHWPMVYKIGFTHDPHSRWWNPVYGYAADKHQRWESMAVIYASVESTGPAFVEAALIQKYKGASTFGFKNF